MPINLNDAGPQRQEGVIPDGTFARVIMQIKNRGGITLAGMDPADNGLFTPSKSRETSDVIKLDVEYIVLTGEHAKRKFWPMNYEWVIDGGSRDEKGHSKGWGQTKTIMRAMVESATGTMPQDRTPQADAKRNIPSFSALNGIEFCAKIGVELGDDDGKGGFYPDRNRLAHVVTPDEPEWQLLMQGKPVAPKPTGSRRRASSGGGSAAHPQAGTPAWATGAQTQIPEAQQHAPAAWAQPTAPAAASPPAFWIQPTADLTVAVPAALINGPAPDPATAPAPETASAGPSWLHR